MYRTVAYLLRIPTPAAFRDPRSVLSLPRSRRPARSLARRATLVPRTNERLLDTRARPTMWVAVHALALLPLPSRLPNQPAVWPCSAAKPAARCRILCCDAEDPWLLLGVSYSATDAQIRRAFRHQARELHPDVCTDPEAPERFRSLVEAFKKLRTDESRARWRTQSRAAYDRRVRGSAKERAARAWGAPDRPRGSTSRPSTAWTRSSCCGRPTRNASAT